MDDSVIMRTNIPALDNLLDNDQGFKSGLWLISYLAALDATTVADALFMNATVTNLESVNIPIQRAFESDRLYIEHTDRLALSPRITIVPSLKSKCIRVLETGSRVIFVEDTAILDDYREDSDSFRRNARALRNWGIDNNALVILFTKLNHEANLLASNYDGPWPELVAGKGYHAYDRRIEHEADGEWIVDLPNNVPEVIRVCRNINRPLGTHQLHTTAVFVRNEQ